MNLQSYRAPSMVFLFGLMVSIFCGSSFGQQNLTVQLPVLGVSIDADGLLTSKLFRDDTNRLMKKRLAQGGFNRAGNLRKPVALRKISLRRLEQAVAKAVAADKDLGDDLLSLVGVTHIQYVFVYPDQKDIVIAGPAEPWVKNLGDRSVGIVSGNPTLMLDDLAVAMRAFPSRQNQARQKGRRVVGPQGGKWVACSIDPSPAGVVGLREFQKTIPRTIAPAMRARAAQQLAQGMQRSLGNADIRVYGISARTHMAQVMIEADYRMKMIGLGLERPPIEMQTFLGALKGAPRDMQRWWFKPDYKRVQVDADELAIELIGSGVELSTENINFSKGGKAIKAQSKPSAASRTYAHSFTKNYAKIEKASPVYQQLRQSIDLLVAFAWLKQSAAYGKVDWSPEVLVDESKFKTESGPAPKHCPCVANAVWKGNMLILPAGGGVSVTPELALNKKNLQVAEAGIGKDIRAKIDIKNSVDTEGNGSWWWD